MMRRAIARASTRGARASAGVIVAAAVAIGVSGAWGEASGGVPQAVDPGQVEVFVGAAPTRVYDTRVPIPRPFGPGEERVVSLAGLIDDRVTSVAINITLDADATAKSFVTVWPTGTPRPNTSANNAEPGLISPNQMIAKLGTDQSVTVFNERGSTNVIIDIVGVLVPLDEVGLGSGLAARFLSGVGAPAAGVGAPGDLYFDTTGKAFYGPKALSGWGSPVSVQGPAGPAGATGATGATGAAGAPGAAFLSGVATPTSQGANGDMYLDTDDRILYGPKTSGSWGAGLPVGPTTYAYGATGVPPVIAVGANVLDFNAGTDIVTGTDLTGPSDTGDPDSNPDTFVATNSGIYEISFSVSVTSVGLGGTVELRVNGVAAGGSVPLTVGSVSRTQLVSLAIGDDLALWASTADLGLGIGSHVITIKKIT